MEKKDKRRAIIGTLGVHAVLLVLLFIFAFRTPLPLPEELGVEVDCGGGGGGGQTGDASVQTPSAVSNIVNPTPNVTNLKTPVLTQNVEPTEAIAPQTNIKPVVNTEPVVDPRISDFWKNKNKNSGSGTGVGSGNGSGVGSGNGSGSGNGDGSGIGPGKGGGTGPGFSLHGRSAKYLPVPDYTEQEQGIVVVDVWVDKSGNVTKAIAGGKGTTTGNASLWKKAQQAALKASFSTNGNAPEEQKGTITYTFIRTGN